jgi:hypothetical protein
VQLQRKNEFDTLDGNLKVGLSSACPSPVRKEASALMQSMMM